MRGVQRDGQAHLQALVGQPAHLGNEAATSRA